MKTLDDRVIDSLTAVELPDRHVLSPVILVVLNVSGNTINVLTFEDIATAVNFCGQQLSGNVLSIAWTDQDQTVFCQTTAN